MQIESVHNIDTLQDHNHEIWMTKNVVSRVTQFKAATPDLESC